MDQSTDPDQQQTIDQQMSGGEGDVMQMPPKPDEEVPTQEEDTESDVNAGTESMEGNPLDEFIGGLDVKDLTYLQQKIGELLGGSPIETSGDGDDTPGSNGQLS